MPTPEAPPPLIGHPLAWSGLILAILLGLAGLGLWSYRDGVERLGEQGRNDLDLHIAYLEGLLAKYEPLPALLATDPRLSDFLRAPGGRESIDALNRYLETINRISDAADTYLMDAEGLTIAASNWQTERPFVGRNFSFRPYFRDAMDGRLGRYFALGNTSGQRGYYFAYPVMEAGQALGAVVVKIDIGEAERRWAKPDRILLVTDPDGVVFLATRPEFRFRTLHPLASERRGRIQDSHRYPGTELTPLGLLPIAAVGTGELVRLDPERPWWREWPWLLQSRPMPTAGWQVHELIQTQDAIRDSLKLVLLAIALLTTLFLIAALRRQHQHGRRLQSEFAEQTRAALERSNLELEARVASRTTELTRSNQRLRDEIEERRRAEQALRETQQALIQSAKLATLGQLSAGINHELNQPLAAIRAYADNGLLLLAKGRLEDVETNLGQILELTERMAKIGAQLKLFARKTSAESSDLPLLAVLEGAARLLAPALERCGGTLEPDIPPGIGVRANDVLLQQVFVNLLGNACQAIADRPERRIRVQARRREAHVIIRVRDTGPGIPEADRDLIFEPFFTTKAAGEGLGLGLAISARIATDMGGALVALPSETGACFELTLPAADLQP